jgi:membrane protein DedA with SNARE-associated domain
VEAQLAELLAWIEPRALILALVLPPIIRVVGHWLPEELFMIAIGVIAARSDAATEAALLLAAVTVSHFVTDQVAYLGGRWLRPRLSRFPRVKRKLDGVTERLCASPKALAGLIPARVFPLGRGAWLAGCGVVGIPWTRFALVDMAALIVHLVTWSGLGWWLADDLSHIEGPVELGKSIALWLVVAAIASVIAIVVRRRWPEWQLATGRAIRRAGDSWRQLRGE